MSMTRIPHQTATKQNAYGTLVGWKRIERGNGVDSARRTEATNRAMWCGPVRKKTMTFKVQTGERPMAKSKANVQRVKDAKYIYCGLLGGSTSRSLGLSIAASGWADARFTSACFSAFHTSLRDLIDMHKRTIHSSPDHTVVMTTPGTVISTQKRMLMKKMTTQRGIRMKPRTSHGRVTKIGSELGGEFECSLATRYKRMWKGSTAKNPTEDGAIKYE